MIDLSILICSTHTRFESFGRRIQEQVWGQYENLSEKDRERVEVQILVDNRKLSLGQKRNSLLNSAQGKYIQFIDDDDRIESDLLQSVLDATSSNADVINFLVEVSVNGEASKICRYSREYESDRNTEEIYERLPNHICCVKRELALRSPFPHLFYGEDSAYSKLLHPLLRSEYHIDRVLYYYDYDEKTTESPKSRGQESIVDVVILSNSPTRELHSMTQNAVNTCINGAGLHPINVIVMEQAGVEYQNALTLNCTEEFHYNKFANRGARYGTAEWIMIANNDLIFGDRWLHFLLSANYPVVSPRCPKDYRQVNTTHNITGWRTGVHFSGWCFMIRRELWEKIGGFDTSVNFWCSDDVVVEQLKREGIKPMLVANSIVSHLGSRTLELSPEKDQLTWAQVHQFNQEHKQSRLIKDPRYLQWQKESQKI